MTFANSPTNQTAKRLPDPTLSSRAFALFFVVTILIAIMLLVAPKASATNRNWQNTSTDLNTGANWSGGQVSASARYGPTVSGSQSSISQNVANPAV